VIAVFAAGGTGGHVFPALAVAQALAKLDSSAETVLVGVGSEIEAKLTAERGIRREVIRFVPLTGKGLRGLLSLSIAVPRALFQAIQLYRQLKPKVVMGFGGYPSVVPVLTAWMMGIPCVVHEQNVEVGLANRMLGLFADKVYAVHNAHGFWRKGRVHYLGNPVRDAFHRLPDWRMPQTGEPFKILIVGGSQGAVSLNSAVLEALPVMRKLGLEIIHQTGALDYERVRKSYADAGFAGVQVHPFIDDIAAEYGRAHLVVCRAGALTVAEVSAAGRPAIFVPLRIARGHQAENVQYLAQRGAALVYDQGPETGARLASSIEDLVRYPEKLAAMARLAREISVEGGLTSAQYLAQVLSGCMHNQVTTDSGGCGDDSNR
jgi:UDP-N-acetylglucosamine--N-acetylmuramyl-(pentapeptide) pyrophosphoryl-undecaprenol N-acetylglucosamine transferase